MVTRTREGFTHHTCPFCGGGIMRNEKEKSILHKAPACEEFNRRALELGLEPEAEPTIFADPSSDAGKERRARAARAKAGHPWTANYQQSCARMLEILQAWTAAHPGETARFALPPDHIFAIAPLDLVVRRALARDQAAGDLVDAFCAAGVEIAGEAPTLVMLRAVLQTAGFPYEIAPYADFGTFALMMPGSSSEN
jgi:hypothetical protein